MWRAITFATFLVCGLFFYVLLSAVAAGTTGLNAVAAIPIVLSLSLGGFAPLVLGIDFRIGVRTGQSLSGLLIGYVLILVASDPSDAFALVATLPLIATIAISQAGLSRRDIAKAERAPWWFIAIGALAAAPAAWLILAILVRLVA